MLALFRSRAAHVSLSVLVAVSVSSSAYADDAAPAAPPAAPPAAMESGTPLFEGTHFGVLTSFNTSSGTLFLAPAINSLLLGVGVAYEHNGNGLTGPTDTNKDSFSFVVTAAYMLHNQVPFAMGPEIAILAPLAPDSFNPLTVVPGWAFWYAPWKAPMAIGTALDVALTFPKSPGKAVIATTTPAVRIVFGFK